MLEISFIRSKIRINYKSKRERESRNMKNARLSN